MASQRSQPDVVDVTVRADPVLPGQINLLDKAAELGLGIVVLVIDDETLASYKGLVLRTHEELYVVTAQFDQMSGVASQESLGYQLNSGALRPRSAIHGDGWGGGVRVEAREMVRSECRALVHELVDRSAAELCLSTHLGQACRSWIGVAPVNPREAFNQSSALERVGPLDFVGAT